MSEPPSPIAPIVSALSGKRYRYNNEAALHRGIMAALDEAGIGYRHEVKIVGGRIDFVVGDVGIEVKIKGSAEALRRQIEGYAPEESLGQFLVLTAKPMHQAINGETANGKRVRTLTIGGLSL